VVKDGSGIFAPLAEALAGFERVSQALFDGIGKFTVGNDGTGESFEAVKSRCVFVAEAERQVERFKGSAAFFGFNGGYFGGIITIAVTPGFI